MTALSPDHLDRFARDGFVILRGFAPAATGLAMEQEIIATIRNDPPAAHPGEPAYRTAGDLFIQPEQKPMRDWQNPEDLISKVFNPHLSGTAHAFAHSPAVADVVTRLLDAPASVFQSQFIFKNPGAWGQPWHQDAYYFPFDRRPQIGVWLAISEATLENGCLAVVPGGHHQPVLEHGPDLRPGSNHGYLEIPGIPEDEAVPVLMDPGDVLVFHSLLPHRSHDNRCSRRRSAMVYHFAATDTRPSVALSAGQKLIHRWQPVSGAA